MAFLQATDFRVDLPYTSGMWPELSAYDWRYVLELAYKDPQTGLHKNTNINFADPSKPIIGDSVVYNVTINGKTYTTNFTGTGLNYDFINNPKADSGIVSGFTAFTTENGKQTIGLTYGGFSISLNTLHTLVSSPLETDHYKYISLMFSGDDTYSGGIRDDVFLASGGNDSINGNAGYDAVKYLDSNNTSGYKRSEFTISKNGDTVVVSDNTPARFGTDTINSIEKIIFQDVSILFDTEGNAGKGYRIYEAAFNRNPDAGGLGFWIAQLDKGTTLKTVAELFLSSAEFKALYGSSPSNAAFVDSLYKNILDRAGEKGGVDYWNGVLNNGVSRADVLVSFSESAENKAGVIGSIQNGIEYKEWLG